MNRFTSTTTRKLMILSIVCVGTAIADEFDINRYTIDGGGVMRSTGGDFELSGTIGQPDAGTMTGGGFDLTGGFWFTLAAGDCNEDGGVGLLDVDDFEGCMTGPEGGPPTGGCRCFDVNRSSTVDLADFALIQSTFTRP